MNKNFKKVISTVAALAMAASSFVAMAATYPDVTADSQYASAIEQLSALGIMEGFDDGTFKPDEKVTRAQMAKLVVGAKNMLAAAESNSTVMFEDVAPGKSDWAIGYVATAAADGIINGTSATTFDPDATVTFAQATKMLVNACGYDAYAQQVGGWPSGYLSYGYTLGINDGVTGVGNDTELTRGQVAQMVANALKAPVLEITGYYTDNGVMVPSYTTYDGKDGNSFRSLLTEKWDVYEVYGQVESTRRMDSTLKADEVTFMIEKSDNFDDSVYNNGQKATIQNGLVTWATATAEKAKVGNTDAMDKLFDYAYALIEVNSDDELTIKYIETSAKSQVVTFNDELYAANNIAGLTAKESARLSLYKSETSSSTTDYKLADDVKLIVNGVVVDSVAYNTTSGAASTTMGSNITKVLDNNLYEAATLVDTPKGASSTDGYYDYIVVNYYATATVDEVYTKANGNKTIATNSGVFATIEIDETDDTKVYTFVDTNGAELTVDDLEKNDVLSIAYDLRLDNNNATTQLAARNSDFINVIVAKNSVEGKVVGTYVDNNKTYYQMDGGDYTAANGMAPSVKIGQTYTFYLDKDGNIAKSELLAVSVNYAVIDKFFTSAGDQKVRLILKDGTKADYVLKANGNGSVYGFGTTDGVNDGKTALVTSTPLYTDTNADSKIDETEIDLNRIVSYTVNSSDEVTLTAISTAVAVGNKDSVTGTTGANLFNATTNRIGSYALAETSVIVDASAYAPQGKGTVGTTTASNLVDDMDYMAIFAGERTNNVYPFVVLLSGNYGFNVNTGMVVVAGAPSLTEVDGEEKYSIPVWKGTPATAEKVNLITADKNVPYNYDANFDGTVDVDGQGAVKGTLLKEGDAFIYSTDSEGEVDYIAVVYSNVTSLATTANNVTTYDFTQMGTKTPKYYNGTAMTTVTYVGQGTKGIPTYTLAPVIRRYEASIDLATTITSNTSLDDGKNYSYASDVKVVAFDMSVKAGNRVSVANGNGVIQSIIPESTKLNSGTTINWVDPSVTPAFALIREIDNDVQEVYSISLAK